MEPAKIFSRSGDAGIVRDGNGWAALRRVPYHRAELENAELLSIRRYPRLTEKDGARGVQLNHSRRKQKHGAEYQEKNGGQRQIEHTLQQEARFLPAQRVVVGPHRFGTHGGRQVVPFSYHHGRRYFPAISENAEII